MKIAFTAAILVFVVVIRVDSFVIKADSEADVGNGVIGGLVLILVIHVVTLFNNSSILAFNK